MNRIKLPRIDCGRVADEIADFVTLQVRRTGTTGCIVGLSGGVDSSTTAALIQRAFKREAQSGFELVGFILPSRLNQEEDSRDAQAVARALGFRCEICSIEAAVEGFRATNADAFASDYHRGNLISRVRANVLSTKAATEKKILAGTGNKDEDFGIGYYTLFGDGAVHLSPIGGLPKRLVREMAAHLSLDPAIVNRIPTAGLEPGQSDYKDLGYDYDVVELISEGFVQGLTAEELCRHEHIQPLVERQIEHYRSCYGAPRHSTVAAVVKDVLMRHEIAKGKMQIIHPPTPAISLIYD